MASGLNLACSVRCVPACLIWFLVVGLLPGAVSGQARGKAAGAAQDEAKSTKNIKVCRGTSSGLTHTGSSASRYVNYRDKYSNCTYLDGNLELVFLTDERDYDLGFLSDIREVTGYILIVSVYADSIPLTNLSIVRGRELFTHAGTSYSVYVALNYDRHQIGVGLKQLGLVSLHEILQGHVFFHNNNELCHEDTVEWSDILPKTSDLVLSNESSKRRKCEPCSESCRFKDKLHCWGPGPEMCQNMTRIGCSPQCDGRCFGDQPSECCSGECAVGCTGDTNADCMACLNFENEGRCLDNCPPSTIYNKELYKSVPNPNFKYPFGSLCVDKCPDYLIASKDACVRECEAGNINVNGRCEPCQGSCPKTCHAQETIHANNIDTFHGCTIIQGSIRILSDSFYGDKFKNIPPMAVDRLSAFESVEEVTGFIQIQAKHRDFASLSFLRNLRAIRGRELIRDTKTAFQIFDTSLRTLGLVSLVNITNGNIVVAENSQLCYASKVNWTRIISSRQSQKVIIQSNKNDTSCGGNVCSSECSSSGCWGPGDDECFLECVPFRLGRKCVRSCDAVPLAYQSNTTECKHCHPECKSRCSDDSSSSCDDCLHVKDGPYCVAVCPETKYPDRDSICQSCHMNCEGGCTGSMNRVGDGACNSCTTGKFGGEQEYEVIECLAPASACEVGFYKKWKLGPQYGPMKGKQGCVRCHDECQACDGPGNAQFCLKCLHVREDGKCVRNCSDNHFLSSNQTSDEDECARCHPRCHPKCTGPTALDCLACKEYLVYQDPDDPEKGFECMEKCPEKFPDKKTEVTKSGDKFTVCFFDESGRARKKAIIIGCVLGGSCVILCVVFLIIYLTRKQGKTKKKKVPTATLR